MKISALSIFPSKKLFYVCLQYMYMKIKVHHEDGILEPDNEYYSPNMGSWLIHGPNFSVMAAKLGTAILYVSYFVLDI